MILVNLKLSESGDFGEYGVFFFIFDPGEPGDFDRSGDSDKKNQYGDCAFSGDLGIYGYGYW